MSDPTNRSDTERRGSEPHGSARRVGETLQDTARDVRDAASSAAGRAKEEGAGLLDAAKERAADVAEEGRRAGADQAQGFARAVHRAADELGQDSPAVARMLHDAAGSLDGMAEALRDQSPGEMLRNAEAWARRQPYVFFGVAALAGFAIARFARSSAADARSHRDGPRMQRYGGTDMTGAGSGVTTGGMAGGATPTTTPSTGQPLTGAGSAPGWKTDQDGTPQPMTRAAATLGGAAAQGPHGTTG